MATKNITDRQVVLAYIEHAKNRDSQSNKYPYNYLMEWTGECKKVCFKAMERAEERGYIDCGVSLRTGWVTDEGLALP
jgi:hypothetical protein